MELFCSSTDSCREPLCLFHTELSALAVRSASRNLSWSSLNAPYLISSALPWMLRPASVEFHCIAAILFYFTALPLPPVAYASMASILWPIPCRIGGSFYWERRFCAAGTHEPELWKLSIISTFQIENVRFNLTKFEFNLIQVIDLFIIIIVIMHPKNINNCQN